MHNIQGEVSEWSMELALKSSDPATGRGFESHPLRQTIILGGDAMLGARRLSRSEKSKLYQADHYYTVTCIMPKDMKEYITKYAEEQGVSVSSLIRMALSAYTGLNTCLSGDAMPLEQFLKYLKKGDLNHGV